MSAISHNALVRVEPLLRDIPDISTSCSSGHLIGPKFLLILLLKGGHVVTTVHCLRPRVIYHCSLPMTGPRWYVCGKCHHTYCDITHIA